MGICPINIHILSICWLINVWSCRLELFRRYLYRGVLRQNQVIFKCDLLYLSRHMDWNYRTATALLVIIIFDFINIIINNITNFISIIIIIIVIFIISIINVINIINNNNNYVLNFLWILLTLIIFFSIRICIMDRQLSSQNGETRRFFHTICRLIMSDFDCFGHFRNVNVFVYKIVANLLWNATKIVGFLKTFK